MQYGGAFGASQFQVIKEGDSGEAQRLFAQKLREN